MTTFTTALDQVEALYVGYFGRAGDAAGTNYWISQLNSGASTLEKMAQSFAVQPEATTKYGYLANPTHSDPGAFVDQVYQNLFNHTADSAGKAYWVGQLTAAAGNPAAVAQFVLNVISGATGTDNTTVVNKATVANAGAPSNTAAPPAVTAPPNTANELVKLTTDVVTPQTAIGTAPATGATGGFFFAAYDITNTRMVVNEPTDGVALVGLVNMAASDYANMITNQFTVVAA
jgi:hypothetical protein